MHQLLDPFNDSNMDISSQYEHWHDPNKKTEATSSSTSKEPQERRIYNIQPRKQTNWKKKKENATKMKKEKQRKLHKIKNEKDRK